MSIVFHYLGHRIDAGQYPKLAAYFASHRDALAPVLEVERPFVQRAGLTP